MIQNSQGKIYYGLHFYPGVAEYQEPSQNPFRVFLNEDTLRAMDPTFAGKPVFVMHVDGVESNIDELRKEADGWVIESFYNAADGKHWVKFIVCSERGENAIKRGMKLSNCYMPRQYGEGGLWNGVSYDKEIKGGEYEHLAIVPNPRYEESIILTPEEFKNYNEEKKLELSKIANNSKGASSMLSLFKRQKVENALDLENTLVVLPKSKREMSLMQVINAMDEAEHKKHEPQMANEEHHVEIGDKKMSVKELKDCYNALKEEHEKLKSEKKEHEEGMENEEDEYGSEHSKDPGNDDKALDNDEAADKEAKKKAEAIVEHEDKELEEAKKKNAREAKEKADRLRNANRRATEEECAPFDLFERVNRGKSRYGSGN